MWQEGEAATFKHLAGEVVHDGLGLDVKVAEHFIRMPAADEADGVMVDLGTEKGHRAAGAKGAGTDVCGKEAKGRANGMDGKLEGGHDVGGGHVVEGASTEVGG